MRKHCSRKVRPKTPPMLVNRGIHNDELELVERQFVEAFAQGYADKIHFDSIADMCNILMIGSTEKGDKPVIELCKTMAIPMQSIRARHAKNGRF
ncbi:hypothetical protein, partial [Propionivibrio sp.]|uniref:hypothetical protein n=1 Tax=Propionivibrio sp. TaxID=2212460 RepID=UPI003BF42A5A